MTLAAGTRLGAYEVLGLLGVGGMGEVYRACDSRLGREAAIKVLPGDLASDVGRLKRFEKEARSASALNHPNIVTVYDLGSMEGVSWIAMERVDGKTLRELAASGPLPVKRVLALAIQVAEGLARAHEAGIVHRDLKPDNVMVTKDGLVKILDFGLAKLTGPVTGSDEGTHLPTETGTSPGMLVGTAGYMSPEQASGQPVDFRSDQFAFGSILYEMVTGKRAFLKKTGVDTLAAVLNEEPEPIASLNPDAPAPLRWVAERCLSKDADGRYASTKDLAAELRTIREHLVERVQPIVAARPRRLGALIALAAVIVLGVASAAYFLRQRADRPALSYRQLTYRRGPIQSARFGPDGETIVYTGAWDGKPMEVFVGRTGSAAARPFGLVDAELLAVSGSGEMAVLLNRSEASTLATVSIGGGTAPREILEDVSWADWAPDGRTLAVVRGSTQIEYPPGKILYKAVPPDGTVSHLRVSPDGGRVAFVDHPDSGSDGGAIAVVDRAGAKTTLAEGFTSAQGLAWSPGGEIFFTATRFGGRTGAWNRDLFSTTLDGKVRQRATVAGNLTLQDISRDGRLLVTRDTFRGEAWVRAPGDSQERELTWLDWSSVNDISRDGRLVLMTGPSEDFQAVAEMGARPETDYFVYLRRTDGSPPVRLGRGVGISLSPDGKWALAGLGLPSDSTLLAYPTGPGTARTIKLGGLAPYNGTFLPDSRRFIFWTDQEGGSRVFVSDIDGGKPRPVTPVGYGGGYYANMIWPDGKWFLAEGPEGPHPGGPLYLCPIEGGAPRPAGKLGIEQPRDWIAGVGGGGREVYIYRRRSIPMDVYRHELATGRRQLIWSLKPGDSAGISALRGLRVTADGQAYVYTLERSLSDLYLVDGLR